MLAIRLLSIFYTMVLLPSYTYLSLFCLFGIFYYLVSFSSFFNSVLSVNQSFYTIDSLSLFIVLLLFLIIFVSYILSFSSSSPSVMFIVFVSLFFFCFQVFTTSHLFCLYFYYEASLIPILYIIIKWGSYPERSLRAIIMLTYTLFFGAPVIVLIMYFNSYTGSWYYPSMSLDRSLVVRLFIFLCFSVKLPIYGLHFWLPMAHVEAPTYGSVILARILLKLGGVGLIRLEELINIPLIKNFIISYFIVFIVFSRVVCCYQSDFKRLIAYSSVAHIIVIPFLIFSNTVLSFQSLLLVMFLHGLRSTLIFMSVGLLYTIFATRQLVLIRGLLLLSPLFRALLVFVFLFTLSAPPFPSYVAEVLFIFSSYMLSRDLLYVVLLFAFLGLVYNLNWLVRIVFSTVRTSVYSSMCLTYSFFISSIIIFIELAPIVLLFYLL